MDHAVQSCTEQTIKNLTVTGIAIYTQRKLQQVSCYSSNENSLPFEIWILGQLHGPMYYKFIQLRPKQNFSKRYALSLTYFTANYCIILNLFNCTFKKKLLSPISFFLFNQSRIIPFGSLFFLSLFFRHTVCNFRLSCGTNISMQSAICYTDMNWMWTIHKYISRHWDAKTDMRFEHRCWN